MQTLPDLPDDLLLLIFDALGDASLRDRWALHAASSRLRSLASATGVFEQLGRRNWRAAAAGATPAAGWRALHCDRCAAATVNCQLLASVELARALNVRCREAPARPNRPPALELCGPREGAPAVYRTKSPLDVVLCVDQRTGAIGGVGLRYSMRYYVERGQGLDRTVEAVDSDRLLCLLGAAVAAAPAAERRRRARATVRAAAHAGGGAPRARPPPRVSVRKAPLTHGELASGLASGAIAAAAVEPDALVGLDPRKHSLPWSLISACESEECSPQARAVLRTTRAGIAGWLRRSDGAFGIAESS